MAIKVGDLVGALTLPEINGGQFDISSLQGKRYLLGFFRFAACPLCNMRVHKLVTTYPQFGDNFSIVAIFDSPLDNLQKFTRRHQAPFPILADHENVYYKKFEVRHSWMGVLIGMVKRLPTMIAGMLRGYFPSRIKGSMATMPLDMLVDEQGVIQAVHYGQDEGDHMPIEQVIAFSRSTD